MFGAYSAPEAAGKYETVTFLFAFLAASAPAHDAALNDLSSTPPVSSAKHALVFVAAVAAGTSTRLDATVVAARMATSFDFFNFPPSYI
jgi:hypothetical protein